MLLTVLLSGCAGGPAGPAQYYNGPGLHGVTAAEVAGSWRCVEGTALTLRPDGSAAFRQLDGQEFDFDDAWRVTGSGTWRLTDGSGGQRVRLSMTARAGASTRADAPAPTAPPDVPPAYEWRFWVDRDAHDELVLFFFYGDPDAGNTYLMTRT
ncbi:hypothetical protein [Streptomyces sp. NPDC001500]